MDLEVPTSRGRSLDDESRLAYADEVLAISDAGRRRIDTIVRLARTLLDVPVAAVNVVARDEVRALVAHGADVAPWPREHGPCTVVVTDDEPVVVGDARADVRLQDLPLVTGEPHVRFYAAQPVRVQGHTVGTMCLYGREPREMDERERALLADLATWVETQIELDQDASEAREVQRRLLPRRSPRFDGWQVAGRCIPTRAIGGDLFDWRAIDADPDLAEQHRADDRQLQISVCDVMGKGLTAAVTAAGLRAVLRGTARFTPIESMMLRIGESMIDDTDDEEPHVTPVLATLFVARLHRDGAVRWADAGHGLACVLGADGSFRELAAGELPLGVVHDARWSVHHETLAPGEALVVVSDGVLGSGSDLTELEDALGPLWRDGVSAEQLVDRIVALGVSLSHGRPSDDITALVAARTR